MAGAEDQKGQNKGGIDFPPHEDPKQETVIRQLIDKKAIELKHLPEGKQQVELANYEFMLRFANTRNTAVQTALFTTYTSYMGKRLDLQDKGVLNQYELLKSSADAAIKVQHSYTDLYLQKYIQNQQAVIDKYFTQATAVQDTVIGVASFGGAIGMILKFIPGYEQMGDQILSLAEKVQGEMAKKTQEQMAVLQRMQRPALNEHLRLLKAANQGLKTGIDADLAPTDQLRKDAPDKLEINSIRDGMRDGLSIFPGRTDFENRSTGSASGTSGTGAGRGSSGLYGPISALSGATRDQVFYAMIAQESNGKQDARSPKGAMGLGQIMPGTAAAAAKAAGVPWDQKKYDTDPNYQLRISRAWFDRLADKYNDNMVLTLAAYNSGEGAVNDFMNGTNLSKNTRGAPTNPTRIRLGDPRKSETTDAAFAEKYQYGETRIYIGKIAGKVAAGIGYDVASDRVTRLASAGEGQEHTAAAQTDAVISRTKDGAQVGVAAVAKAKGNDKPVQLQPDFTVASSHKPAPKTSKGDIKGLGKTAAEMSFDGQAGSFADGAKNTPVHISLRPLALTLDRS